MSAVRSENKESCSSPVDGVLQAVLEVRRGWRWLEVCAWLEGRRKREEGEHLEKTFLLFKLKGAWLTLRQVTLYDR